MADKQIKKLPGQLQTTVLKNFFETTVEQLFSKSNIESISAYVGRKEFEQFNAGSDFYIHEHTPEREKYSLEPVVNSLHPVDGNSTNILFYEDFLNQLNSYGADTNKQNVLFDTNFYSFLPPVDYDKLVNYQEYFWSTEGPRTISLNGTSTTPINILKDILGKKSYTSPNGVELKNGAIIEFTGENVIPESYLGARYIVEGVGESIILYAKEQNYSAVFSTPAFEPWDQEVITAESNLIATNKPSGAITASGLAGRPYYDALGQLTGTFFNTLEDITEDGKPYWKGYVVGAGGFLSYINDGQYGFDNGPWDGGNTQETPDYMLMQRGSTDNNTWSRINFWHHKDRFIESGSSLPGKEYRAKRPILEFDRNLELYNFGNQGLTFSADLSGQDYTLSEIEGRPISAPLDSQGLKINNKIIIPDEETAVSRYIYVVEDEQQQTVNGNVSSSNTIVLNSTTDVYIGATISGTGVTESSQVVTVNRSTNTITSTNADTIADGTVLTFKDRVKLTRLPADNNPSGAVDGDSNFVPYMPEVGDIVSILFGNNHQGKEYYWSGTRWLVGQQKTKVNTAPLFQGYDVNKKSLGDELTYPQSSFKGTKIFSYKPGITNTVNDSVLGFPLQYKNFNNFSEIVYDNNLSGDVISYIPFGGNSTNFAKGYIYYKKTLPNGDVIFDTNWIGHKKPFSQKVEDTFVVTQIDVDTSRIVWEISAIPNNSAELNVKINGEKTTAWTYDANLKSVTFNTFTLKVNDVIEIRTQSDTGLIVDKNRHGRFELPISWYSNTEKADVITVSEPQYLEHIVNYIGGQKDITGNILGTNNFINIEDDKTFADRIVQTDDDLQMAGFLISNDKFNVVDAMRFNGEEYLKYKNRLKKEIKKYINSNDTTGLTNHDILEDVLQNVISYNPGKLVFDYSYMLALGDRYDEETIVTNNIIQKEYTLANYLDKKNIENTILVYDQNTNNEDVMLLADKDYVITSASGVCTLTFTDSYTLTLGNTIKVRFFNKNRESAQCPPTTAAMGLTPVYMPEMMSDTSFKDPINVIVGHDGSRTIADNDLQDEILLEFERRVYNSIQQVYRERVKHPDLNVHDIRPGQFRNTNIDRTTYYNILRENFNKFVSRNEVDFVTNEYYDANQPNTWNYNYGTASPGYWRGIFEACYDTERPHTHPWEMLGFIKKPTWWDSQYITTTYTNYGSGNKPMWKDLEEGIIRQGTRENVTNDAYKINNPYRRIGLSLELPVNINAERLAPANIVNTSATTKTVSWTQTATGSPTANASSFISTVDGLNIIERTDGTDTFLNVTGNNLQNHTVGTFPIEGSTAYIESKEVKYVIQSNATSNVVTSFASATSTSNTPVGITVNGSMLFNANAGVTIDTTSNWHYNNMYRNESGRDTVGGNPNSNNVYGYIQPGKEAVGLTVWSTTSHSPIIGWSFDGLPIYGPYGYTDRLNDTSAIKRLESSYSLRTGLRSAIAPGVGGTPSGEFIEDYIYDSATGDLDEFNGRFGVTPEFPGGTYYYVATIDSDGNPAYPYTTGPKYRYTPTDLANNILSAGTHSTAGAETYKLTNTLSIVYASDTTLTGSDWKFGDGAPVENAWKYSEQYPFAIAEALFLTKPGKFASVFAEPEKIIRGSANAIQLLDKTTFKRYKIKDAVVHGNLASDKKTLLTNTGYTQFIDSYLRFQGISTQNEFAIPFKSVNGKLGHKFAGFIDKDTMTVFSDSYSTTGDSSSLILPHEDIQVNIHNGPMSTTNHYTGVNVELTTGGYYKVNGFASTKRFFEISVANKDGQKTEVSVGGEPADFSTFDIDRNYTSGDIVKSGYNYYQAKGQVPAGTPVTSTDFYQRLPKLPTTGSAEATYYLEGTGEVQRVEYGTVYKTKEALFEFLIDLGRHQKEMGYDFNDFNNEIGDVNDWLYSGKQFLFWSLGNWSAGNTLSLSPMASKIKFISSEGRISDIKESFKGQFSILDETGKKILPTECAITREGQTITVSPPEGSQIFGIIIHTNSIEHTMLINNRTVFGDTIYDPVFNHRQKRLKVKVKRTKNWDGSLMSEGYLITEDSLKPNFDTLAQDMGRYNETGHIPVERQVYETSRRQYGYNERKYLREFELVDDNQFDFYSGMIRDKGTKASIEKLLNSDKVLVPGSLAVYDEWALKAGEFGDIQNHQRLDIKIADTEITSEKQLIQVVYPEDIVSTVSEVEVLGRVNQFYTVPILEIEPPPAEIPGSFQYGGGTTAKADVNLNTDGTIKDITVTEPGYGYTINPSVTVIAAQLLTANITTYFSKPYAVSSAYIDNNGSFSGNALTGIYLTDNFSANAASFINLSSASNISLVADAINTNATTNANVTAEVITISTASGNSTVNNYMLQISGNDFTVGSNSNSAVVDDITNKLKIQEKRYQPRQRYSFETANTTTQSEVLVNVSDTATSAGTDWLFDAGSRTTINPTQRTTTGSISFDFSPMSGTSTTLSPEGGPTSGAIASDNLQIINGNYPHLEIKINGIELSDSLEGDSVNGFSVTNVDSNTNRITFHDVTKLPQAELNSNTPIDIIELATIDFEDSYQGDLPGQSLNIKVKAKDALAAKLKQIRTLEITPDVKTDATILVDVDDSNRLVHRPTDMRTKNLWPTTSSVSHVGIVDSKYTPLPNAGYVSTYNVQYQAMDLPNFEKLFNRNIRPASKIPQKNDVVHFAKSEHSEFDVYKLVEPANSNIAYIEEDPDRGTSFLYTDVSLNEYANANYLGNAEVEANITNYYDYVVALKRDIEIDPYYANIELADGEKAYDTSLMDVNTPVALFLNENQIVKNSIEISGIGYKEPLKLKIEKVEPALSGNISNVSYYLASNEVWNVDANLTGIGNTIKITHEGTEQIADLEDGSYITFTDTANTYPLDKSQSGIDYKASNVVVSPLTTKQTKTGTVDNTVHTDTLNGAVSGNNIVLTTGSFSIQVGQIVSGTGVPANTSVSAITDDKNYTLSASVTMGDGDAIGFATREDVFAISNVITTSFTVEDANVSANISSSSLRAQVNSGLKFTTDMDLTNVGLFSTMKINNMGLYSGIYRVNNKNIGTGEISVYGRYVDSFSATHTFTGVDTATITVTNANTFLQPGMLVSGGNVAANTTIVDVTATGVVLSANANSDANSNITFSDNLYANATVVHDSVDITFAENHTLKTDGTDIILNKTVNIIDMSPSYYNWAWRVIDVPTANTLTVQGFGYDHPYTTGGNTYISKIDFIKYDTDALTTTPGPDTDAYLISKHEGEIYVNGAKVATAFPMHTSQEYVDEINRQIQIKNGTVINCGSFKMALPGLINQKRNGGGGGAPYKPGKTLPNNTAQNITSNTQIPQPGTPAVVTTPTPGTTRSNAGPKEEIGYTIDNYGMPIGWTVDGLGGSQYRDPKYGWGFPVYGLFVVIENDVPQFYYRGDPGPIYFGYNYWMHTVNARYTQRSSAQEAEYDRLQAINNATMSEILDLTKMGLFNGVQLYSYTFKAQLTGTTGIPITGGTNSGGNTGGNTGGTPDRTTQIPSFTCPSGYQYPDGVCVPVGQVGGNNSGGSSTTSNPGNTGTTIIPASGGNNVGGGATNPGGTGAGSTNVNNGGTTPADFTPLIAITQHDDACPPPPPPPPPPPQPPVGEVCRQESNSQGRGQTESFKYTFTSDTSQTYPIKLLFDTYSAKDRITIYQSHSQVSRGTKVASTRTGDGIGYITQADINAWANTTFQASVGQNPWNANQTGAVSGLLGQNYTSHGDGYVKENGKISWTYNASLGQYITITVEKDSATSTAFRYFICFPVDDANGTGFPASGTNNNNSAIGNPPAGGNQSQFPNLANQSWNQTLPNYNIAAIPNFGNLMAGSLGLGGGSVGPLGGNAFANYFSGSYPSINFTTTYSGGLVGPNIAGLPSYNLAQTTAGGSTTATTTTSTANQPGNNINYLTIGALQQNSTTGQYSTVPGSTTNVPICPPKARVKVCGQQKMVGAGDSFFINGDEITLSGATDIEVVRTEILAQTTSVDVMITTDSATQEKCLFIRNKVSDPMIIRNGCAGGVHKEVLDYSLKADEQMCFNKETVQNPTVTTTTTGAQRYSVSGGTVDLASGSTGTTAYGTPTIKTPRELQQKGEKSSICLTRGSGYAIGDVLRVMGGTPVVDGGTTSVESLIISRPGYGYIDPTTGTMARPIEIRIGSRGEPGSGAVVDYTSITFDGNGGISGINGSKVINMLQALGGSGYSIDNPPTITVIGSGRDCIITAKLKDRNIAVEKTAKFIVKDIDQEGGIKDLQVINRGIYKIFPSDLDSGVPLQYDIKRPIDGVDNSELLGTDNPFGSATTPGTGVGARVFLTARDIPSCSEKGTALTDLGLPTGIVFPVQPAQQVADDIAIWSPLDENGNPFFTGEFNTVGSDGELNTNPDPTSDDPFGEIVIGGPNIDGITLSDPLNPGFLNAIGLLEGDYTCDEQPLFKNIDETGIDPKLVVEKGALQNLNSFTSGRVGPAGNYQGTLPWNRAFNLGMNLGNAEIIDNLYEYELRQIDGVKPITFTDQSLNRQNVTPLLLNSMRFDTESGLDLANISNAWIDSYGTTNGWAYLENNTVIRQQEPLTDVAFIDDAIIYDEETAEKEYDINLYDPFKGIIPGFIDKEITYKSEADPVVYDPTYTKFGKQQVGQTWWNTSKVRYNWYEQGAGTYSNGYNNTERNRDWGSKFPGSEICIYEWTENLVEPSNYNGEGEVLGVGNFITEKEINSKGKEITYYYYWVRKLSTVSDFAKSEYGRDKSILELELLLENPEGNRMPYLGLMSPDAYTVNKLGDLIKTEDSIVSLNFRRKDSGLSKKHTSWALAGEGNPNADIPNNLSIKVIDSLAGYNALDEEVPVKGLSAGERYGSKFRPRQTMFKDLLAARKQMFESLNDIFKELQMDTTFNNWRNGLPSSTPHLDTVNWFEILRTDKTIGTKLYYNSDYKPLRRVKTDKQLQLIKNLLDKSVIQVQSNDSEPYKLYEYSKGTKTFKLIAMENETVEWNPSIYSDRQTLEVGQEVRQVLIHLYYNVFTGSNKIYWNRFFFDMVKFAIGEQKEVDWAFKSTYLNVVKQETDLVPFKGLKVDNFDKAVDYFNEVKPYASKIRNYRDIKQAPIENLIGSTSDFDRPPYFDEDAQEVRILDANISADANVLSSDTTYAGFVSNNGVSNSRIRQMDTKIVFDRVKADLFENSTGIQTTRIVATSNNTNFALSFTPSDVSRIEVRLNDVLVPATGTSSGTAVTNWTYNAEDNVITVNKTSADNPMLLSIEPGDVIDIVCIDGYDPNKETLSASIAKNIVKIETNSNANISNSALSWTASDREFKFNSEIRTSFITAMENAHGIGAGSNTSFTTNTTIMTDMVSSGNLKNTIALVKTAVGGDFNGSMLDANTFIDVVPGTHPTTYYTNTRGFDYFLWDTDVWDKEVNVENFHGVFNEDRQGNVNYRINDETVYGFDAVTFTKAPYGPERPEELIVVQPFETLIMNVHTSNVSYGNVAIGTTSSKPVNHTMFMDLFGRTDFYRRANTGITTTSATVNSWENTISVVDVSNLPVANESNKGVIWINSERIEYTGVDSVSNKLLGIIRGTRGTTANPIIASGSHIYNGEESENIALAGYRDPQDLNWLTDDADSGADNSYVTVSLCDTSGDATENTIVGFIQKGST